jgi:hypothetical protein
MTKTLATKNLRAPYDSDRASAKALPIPPEWENLRRSVSSAAGRHAIIAGGAIRDHLLGIPIKDIDVFVLGMTADAAKAIFKAEIIEYAGVEEARHQYQTIEGLRADLCFSRFDNVDEVLSSFDLGICRVAWDGWKYVLTEDFQRDRDEKTITVFRPSEGGHLDRVFSKLEPHGFTIGKRPYMNDYLSDVRELDKRKGYRLMHRRNGKYWLMRDQPMELEEVLEILAWK